jgi:hypothetical protein
VTEKISVEIYVKVGPSCPCSVAVENACMKGIGELFNLKFIFALNKVHTQHTILVIVIVCFNVSALSHVM